MGLVKEHFDRQKVEKQREQLKNELGKLRKLKTKAESTIEKQHAEIGKLTSIIQKLEDDTIQQHKEYDQVINERDILGTQLIRRNDELALLYEKLKIQQSTLNKGEAQYNDRTQDIRLMKLQIQDLTRKLKISMDMAAQVPELKREVKALYNDLIKERDKVKNLSDDLETPMNVHRWRKLEGTDPTANEMRRKIEKLQKSLIKKTEEVVEKELDVQANKKLCVELKNILARQPGPEVAEQLSVYQQNFKEKTRQMKSMAAELNMFQAQTNEFKYEIQRLEQENSDLKRFYDGEKKRRIRLESKRSEDKTERETLQQQMKQMGKEITIFKKENDKKEKGIADLQRNADMQQKVILRERQNKLEEQEKVSLTERNVARLQSAVTRFQQEAQEQRKLIFKLEKARER